MRFPRNRYSNDGISYVAIFALKNPKQACYILTELFPRCSDETIHLSVTEWTFIYIVNSCPNCGCYHLWDIVLSAIKYENLDLVAKLINFRPNPEDGEESDPKYHAPVP